jgi:hypothetical protein
MGLTHLSMEVTPAARSTPRRSVDFLVDSGAAYSVLPRKVWQVLLSRQVLPMRFVLALRAPRRSRTCGARATACSFSSQRSWNIE